MNWVVTANAGLIAAMLLWPSPSPAFAETGATDTVPRYSLPALISHGLSQNPEVLASRFDTDAASSRTQAAEAARFPQLTIEGGYTKFQNDVRMTPASYNGQTGVFGDQLLSADLVLRLPLYSGGRLMADVKAAELLEMSLDHRLSKTKSDLVYNISALYYGILAQKRLIEALEFSEATLASHLEQVNRLIAERKAARVDALRTQAKMEDLAQRKVREQNAEAIQKKVLLGLIGKTETADYQLQGELAAPPGETRPLADLLRLATDRRADLSANRFELDAQRERVASAEAGDWPVVNLVAASGVRAIPDADDRDKGRRDGYDNDSRVGVLVSIPLFDGQRTSARVSEEKSKQAAALRRMEKQVIQARLDVETAYANLNSARVRLASTRAAIDLSRESLRIEREKYSLGRGTLLDVLDAQSALLDAQSNDVRALADANIAVAQLAWATGEILP